mgnify:CR=1 FL=1
MSSAALLYLVVKEGAQGTAKRLAVAVKVVTELLARNSVQLGGLLGAAIRQLLSTSPGRLLLALGASILCISWKLRRTGATVQMSSSVSLLFGLIKWVLVYGKRAEGVTFRNENRETLEPPHAAAAASESHICNSSQMGTCTTARPCPGAPEYCRVQGNMGVRLGPGGFVSDDEPRSAPTDELRINCPQVSSGRLQRTFPRSKGLA